MRKLSPEQKAKAKQARREAYLAMKEKRDKNPEYIALKAAQKQKRKEIYEQIKNRRKSEKAAKKAQERQEKQSALLKMIDKATDLRSKNVPSRAKPESGLRP